MPFTEEQLKKHFAFVKFNGKCVPAYENLQEIFPGIL